MPLGRLPSRLTSNSTTSSGLRKSQDRRELRCSAESKSHGRTVMRAGRCAGPSRTNSGASPNSSTTRLRISFLEGLVLARRQPIEDQCGANPASCCRRRPAAARWRPARRSGSQNPASLFSFAGGIKCLGSAAPSKLSARVSALVPDRCMPSTSRQVRPEFVSAIRGHRWGPGMAQLPWSRSLVGVVAT